MALNTTQEDGLALGFDGEPHWKQCILPGFKFFPTDRSILTNYLPRKLLRQDICLGIIHDYNVYQCHPSELPGLNKTEGEYSFYFTSRKQKYPNGKRLDRNTMDGKGYWRTTSKCTELKYETTTGKKSTLVYFLKAGGEKGKGRKTNWIMHEYGLDESHCPSNDLVLCRIYERKPEKTEHENKVDHQTYHVKRQQSPTIQETYEIRQRSCSNVHEPTIVVNPTAQVPIEGNGQQQQLEHGSELQQMLNDSWLPYVEHPNIPISEQLQHFELECQNNPVFEQVQQMPHDPQLAYVKYQNKPVHEQVHQFDELRINMEDTLATSLETSGDGSIDYFPTSLM